VLKNILISVKWRLAGGNFSNEGRVEVYYNGIWGTISTIWWNINSGNVVCRSLGFPAATFIFISIKPFFGTGNGKIWICLRSHCTGHEQDLAHCPNKGWGNTPSWCSDPYYTMVVVCGQPQGKAFR
jgi:hypothetical protein